MTVVTFDGLSGSGKSTLARQLAQEHGWEFLDTGSMYRALGLWAWMNQARAEQLVQRYDQIAIEVDMDPEHPGLRLNGEDVAEQIRTNEVGAAASVISADPQVRELLVAAQRKLIQEAQDRCGGIVVDGRDIGTVVAPDATVKFYVDADAMVRAQRRTLPGDDVFATLAALRERDERDLSRENSPLRPAADAIHLDNSAPGVDAVLAQIREHVAAALDE